MDAPSLPAAVADEHEYEHVRDESADAFSIAVVSVTQHTRIYEHAPTAAALEDGRTDAVSLPLRGAFVGGLRPSPSLDTLGMDPAGVFDQVTAKGEEVFAETFADYGLTDVELVETREVERYDEVTAHLYEYAATYPLADGAVDCTVWAAVWPTADAFDVAGGCYPTSAAEGIDVAPERDRERVLSVILNAR